MAKKKVTTKRMLDKKVSKPDEKIDPAKAHVVIDTVEMNKEITNPGRLFGSLEVVQMPNKRCYIRLYVRENGVPDIVSISYTEKQVKSVVKDFLTGANLETFVKPKGKK